MSLTPKQVTVQVNGIDYPATLTAMRSPDQDAPSGDGAKLTEAGRFTVQFTDAVPPNAHVEQGDAITMIDDPTTTTCVTIIPVANSATDRYLVVEPDRFNEWVYRMSS